MSEKKQIVRLPRSVLPKNYDLVIVPDLINSIFDGDISIEIKIEEPTEEIKLNSSNLEFNSILLKNDIGTFSPIQITTSDDEILTIKFASMINPGMYHLNMSYKGKINDNLKGLYRSNCINENGTEEYAAVTEMVPTDARRCFPCWDEPNFKATFDISLTVSKDLLALSNMPIRNNEKVGDKVRYNFERSPMMSTYLVVMIIGQYDYIEGKSNDGVLVRVYTPKGKSEQGRFALDITTKILPYYKNYFSLAYPLPKLDLIAVADLSYSAMENWGLITYKENRVLVDPQNTSAAGKQRTALCVGHEVAHQWFGNLVTMQWWTDLWLNEGYATYIQSLCVEYLFPEYEIWTQFVHTTHCVALDLDSLKNSHPIEVPIQNPADVFEIFDVISYYKGASVIRMLVDYIGDVTFRNGMHFYLKSYEYKNASTDDLWRALEEKSEKPVREVMSSWTKQMGFPLIRVTRKISENQKCITLTLSQSKFNADGSSSSDCHWMVPISISSSANPSKKLVNVLLKTSSTEIVVPDVEPTHWVNINVGTVGFYRTLYTPEMLDLFLPDIRNGRIPAIDRLGLLSDLFATSKAGYTSITVLLTFLEAFADETNYHVWSVVVNILESLETLLEYTTYENNFKNYQKRLLANIAKQISWDQKENESHIDALLRSLILDRLATLEDEAVVEEAKRRFEKHVLTKEQIPADLRQVCYKTVLRTQGKGAFDNLLKLYRATDLLEERNRIIRCLGAAKDPELLENALEFCLSDEVRSGDKIFGIISISQTKLGRDKAWKLMKSKWTEILLFASSGSLLPRLVKQSIDNFASDEATKEIEIFFEKNDYGIERSVQQVLESIQLNVAWLRRNSEVLKAYFN